MLLADSRTARVLVTVLLFALALGFLYVARATLIAFLFAIFFAYLMSPLVNRLESLLRGRVRAIAAIYALLLALVVVFFVVVGPKVTHEGARLGKALPDLLSQLSSGEVAKQLGLEHGWSKTSTDVVQSFLVSHSDEITQLAQRIGLRVADVAKQAWLFVVVPLLSIFFLKDGRSFSDFLLSAIQSRPQREFLENVLNDLNQMLAHFIRAQLTLAALTLVMYSAFLGIMGVPYALVLGTLGGLLEFIPVVGPLAAALVIVSVALLLSYKHWLILIIFLGIWRLVQDYVSSPRIMGESMELHPLAAIFGVMAGGEVAGILGVYLSIPVMASSAHRVPPLAPVCRKEKVRSAHRISLPCARDPSSVVALAVRRTALPPRSGKRIQPAALAVGGIENAQAPERAEENRHKATGRGAPDMCPPHRSLLLSRTGSGHLVHRDFAQKFRCGFRQNRVDEHSRPQLEPGHARQPRNHADVPVKVPGPGIFGRTAAHREIQVRISQAHIDLRQQSAQHARQVVHFHFRDVAEAGHVAQRKNVRGKGRG